MFRFKSEQLVYDIGGVKVGGRIGENPTVMIGSIFYKGDKRVQDNRKGTFNKDQANERITKVEELSDRSGLSAMLDVVCTNETNTKEYLEFAADATKMPLLIDAVSEEAAVSGIEVVKELGVSDRTVLNSITPATKESVFKKVKEGKLEAAIILTYSSRAIISSKERISVLEAIIPKVKASGIKKILVDTVVLDIATLGLACKAIIDEKDRFGYPAGCGAHNAISSWKSLTQKKDETLTLSCSAIANGLPIALGADFVLYGPIDTAESTFTAISLIDASYGQLLIEEGVRLGSTHPRRKIAKL